MYMYVCEDILITKIAPLVARLSRMDTTRPDVPNFARQPLH